MTSTLSNINHRMKQMEIPNRINDVEDDYDDAIRLDNINLRERT